MLHMHNKYKTNHLIRLIETIIWIKTFQKVKRIYMKTIGKINLIQWFNPYNNQQIPVKFH